MERERVQSKIDGLKNKMPLRDVEMRPEDLGLYKDQIEEMLKMLRIRRGDASRQSDMDTVTEISEQIEELTRKLPIARTRQGSRPQ